MIGQKEHCRQREGRDKQMLGWPLSTLHGKAHKKEVRVLRDKALDTEEKKNLCYSYHLNSARCTGAEGSTPTTWSWLSEDYCIFPNQEALRQEEETLVSDNNLVFKAEDDLGNII